MTAPERPTGCPDADELSALFDGELAPRESQAVAAHAAACQACAAALGRHAATSQLMRGLARPTISEGAVREVALAARREAATGLPATGRGWMPLAAVLLVAVLGGGAFVAAWRISRREVSTTAAALPANEQAKSPRAARSAALAEARALDDANVPRNEALADSKEARLEAEELESALAAQAGAGGGRSPVPTGSSAAAAPPAPPGLSPSSPLAGVVGKEADVASNEYRAPASVTEGHQAVEPPPPAAPGRKLGAAASSDDFAPSPRVDRIADSRSAGADLGDDAGRDVAQQRDPDASGARRNQAMPRADERQADVQKGAAREREPVILRKSEVAAPPSAAATVQPAMPPARSATSVVLSSPCRLDEQGRLLLWAPDAARPASVELPLWVERLPAYVRRDAEPVKVTLLVHLNGKVTLVTADGHPHDGASVQAALAHAARQPFWCGGTNREALLTVRYVPGRDQWSGRIAKTSAIPPLSPLPP